jgi:hypothetical protein
VGGIYREEKEMGKQRYRKRVERGMIEWKEREKQEGK